MKKTLVALAVLAASGASFAQATVTGTYAAGYRMSHDKTGADASGLGIDSSNVTFTATEDLGGGTVVKAYYGLDAINRAGAKGGNSGMSIAGSFGKLEYSLDEGSEFVTRGGGQAGGVSFDGKVTSSLSPAGDGVTYSYPLTSAVTLAVDYSESGAVEQALGAGSQGDGAITGQRQYQARVAYVAGPVNVTARYATYDSKGTNAMQDNRVRLAGSYDLGVAKIGAAYSRLAYVVGTRTDTGLTVNVPLGALTVGASYANRNWDNAKGSMAADGNANGYSFAATYALSKRTSVIATYARWNNAAADAEKSSETNLLLAHSF